MQCAQSWHCSGLCLVVMLVLIMAAIQVSDCAREQLIATAVQLVHGMVMAGGMIAWVVKEAAV